MTVAKAFFLSTAIVALAAPVAAGNLEKLSRFQVTGVTVFTHLE